MDERGAFVAARTVRREPRALAARLLLGMGFASVLLFDVGLFPAYLLERYAGPLRDASERCPEPIPSEQGYDVECARGLIGRGPISVGKELLAGSFVLGTAALIGALHLDRRFVTWSAATLISLPYSLIGAPLVFWRRVGGSIQAANLVGLVAIVASAAIAWRWDRRAIVGLSIVCTSRRGSACSRGTRSVRSNSSG